LTYLVFLKIAYERTMPPWNQPWAIPAGYEWLTLLSKEGNALEALGNYAERSASPNA
jgi:type I restriction enzyme M protein